MPLNLALAKMKYVLLLILMAPHWANGEMFIEAQNKTSGRSAILEENGSSAWLYLTRDTGRGVEKDAFVFSPIPPAKELNKASIKAGNPPVLVEAIASATAVIDSPQEQDFELVWSKNGESIAVLYEGAPISMIVESEKRGFSKALVKSSPFGHPWDQDLFESEFGE